MTDAQRAADLADALLGPVATDEIRALLREAFQQVRLEERNRVLQSLRESIRIKKAEPVGWAQQGTWS